MRNNQLQTLLQDRNFQRQLQFAIRLLVQREQNRTLASGRRLIAGPASTPIESNIETFMGTPASEIPTEFLLRLDGHWEDAREILEAIKASAQQGKNIFLNPHSTENNTYSQQAIEKIKDHPICKDYIQKHEAEQERIAQIPLPNEFYTSLQEYLMEIYRIGDTNPEFWGYMTPNGHEDHSKLSACNCAREKFLASIKNICTDEQQRALALKTITAQLRGGAAAEVKFNVVVNGEEPYECIITQQIFLWSMVRAHNPDTTIPEKIKNHPQDRLYNLNITQEQSFRAESPDFGMPFEDQPDPLQRLLLPILIGLTERLLRHQEHRPTVSGDMFERRNLDQVPELLSRARRLTSQGDDPAALAIYNRLVDIVPNNVNVRVERATIFERRNEFDNAISDYEHARSGHTNVQMIADSIARLQRQQLELTERSLRHQERRRTIFGDMFERRNLGQVSELLSRARRLTSEGDDPAALATYNRLVDIVPDNVNVRVERATIFERRNEFDNAISDYEHARSGHMNVQMIADSIARLQRQQQEANRERLNGVD